MHHTSHMELPGNVSNISGGHAADNPPEGWHGLGVKGVGCDSNWSEYRVREDKY